MIAYETEDRIAIITLNSPKMNLLSRAFVEALNYALLQAERDQSVFCIFIHSTLSVFSAGADLTELLTHTPEDPDFLEAWHFMDTISKPIIVCVEGPCLGGGFELALMGDLLYASSKATFGFPEITLNLMPGGGGTIRILDRLNVSQAFEILLTGKTLSCETAHTLGIVNHVFEPDVCFFETKQIAKRISQFDLDALLSIKKMLKKNAVMNDEKERRLLIEKKEFYTLLHTKQGKQGIEDFFDKKNRG